MSAFGPKDIPSWVYMFIVQQVSLESRTFYGWISLQFHQTHETIVALSQVLTGTIARRHEKCTRL